MGKLHRAVVVSLLACVPLASACLERELKPLNPCLVSSVSRKVSVNNIDKVDLLFMVDNSGSMAEEQSALKEQFPHMITVLTTGMRSPTDMNPFPPANDLHLGVVSSDMGTMGQANVVGCDMNGGDDGRLQSLPRGAVGCQAMYPPFLSYIAMRDTPQQISTDFGCIAELGTAGCGYEQQLEAPFKALWPSVYTDANGAVAVNPYSFLGVTPQQMLGRGDQPAPEGSLGFIRADPNMGLSLIAVILVTDEEDCSSQKTDHFRIAMDPADPLTQQGTQVRCFNNKQNLYDVNRYITGFKQLRPGYEKLVVFAGIVGVPPNLVDARARGAVDLGDEAQRNAYYDRILNDPRMQELVINGISPLTASMNPSCTRRDRSGMTSTAFPPRRIVEVAKGFGENGVIQSICQDDFGPAMDAIIEVIARQLGAVCLPRPLIRKADGMVPCNVVWELPPGGQAPSNTPTECAQLPYLKPVDPGRPAVNDRGGANCKVDQLAVRNIGAAPAGAGWYYDNFSDGVSRECLGTQRQRVSFTNAAKPATGIVVKLECLDEIQRLPVAGTDVRGEDQPELGSGCVDVRQGMRTVSGDAACVVSRTSGPDRSMFCHPDMNVCVKSCQSSNDCPAAWECDTREQTVASTKGRAYCVNPTCGAN